jgi:HD-like signal output (HDOD) protein
MESIAIIEKIRLAEELPSLPTVVLEALKLTEQPDASMVDIAAVVERDPALAGKLLRVANSSLFGMPRKVTSLSEAASVLGLRTLKVLILSFSLMEVVESSAGKLFSHTRFWQRSVTTATAARLVATHRGFRYVEEAFVAGLLCDIGVLAAHQCAADLYKPVLEQQAVVNCRLEDIEPAMIGTTHAQISETLLDHWRLPPSICTAVGLHHGGDECDLPDDETAALSGILQAASMMADLFFLPKGDALLPQLHAKLLGLLNVSEATLDELLVKLDENIQAASEVFAIERRTMQCYQDIREAIQHQDTPGSV